MRDVLVLGFFLPSLPVCFMRPFYGVLLWTIVAFVNPQHLAYGRAAAFPLAQAVAIPTLAGFLFFNRNWGRLVSREFLLIRDPVGLVCNYVAGQRQHALVCRSRRRHVVSARIRLQDSAHDDGFDLPD